MPSATIKVFLAHGDPKRLRTAEFLHSCAERVLGPCQKPLPPIFDLRHGQAMLPGRLSHGGLAFQDADDQRHTALGARRESYKSDGLTDEASRLSGLTVAESGEFYPGDRERPPVGPGLERRSRMSRSRS